ncbi:MAG: type II toxin-antitoxin system HicB family antitoxin [Candidatus Brocadiales bacterium]
MKREFTAVFEKRGRRYIGYVREIPGVNTQGTSLSAARKNLKEALTLILQSNRELASQRKRKQKVLEEPISIEV